MSKKKTAKKKYMSTAEMRRGLKDGSVTIEAVKKQQEDLLHEFSQLFEKLKRTK